MIWVFHYYFVSFPWNSQPPRLRRPWNEIKMLSDVCILTRCLCVLRLSSLDFVLVYEEINDNPPTKEVLRFRNRYMKNLQKSQLEFEEVCFRAWTFLWKNPWLILFDKRNSKPQNSVMCFWFNELRTEFKTNMTCLYFEFQWNSLTSRSIDYWCFLLPRHSSAFNCGSLLN